MLVYRVETVCGLGAYSCDADFDGEERPTSPMPAEDVKLDWYGDWGHDWADQLFAFESLEAFRSWFRDYGAVEALHEAKCYLSVFDAQVYKLGDAQCCFDPERAKFKYKLCLLAAFDGEVVIA